MAHRLGKFIFEFELCELANLEEFSSLFQQYSPTADEVTHKVALDAPDVRSLVNLALTFHEGCLWADAACLVAPSGRKVMIAGASHSGKSTSSLALALEHSWKIVSEDITLFDGSTDELVTFASPVSLKPGTFERLRANHITAPSLVLDEWIPLDGMAVTDNVMSASVDIAFFFDVVDKHATAPLVISPLTAADYVRMVLPISNLLHSENNLAKIRKYLTGAECYRLSGGTISERLTKINQLAQVS